MCVDTVCCYCVVAVCVCCGAITVCCYNFLLLFLATIYFHCLLVLVIVLVLVCIVVVVVVVIVVVIFILYVCLFGCVHKNVVYVVGIIDGIVVGIVIGIVVVVLSKNMNVDCVVNVYVRITTDGKISCYHQLTVYDVVSVNDIDPKVCIMLPL